MPNLFAAMSAVCAALAGWALGRHHFALGVVATAACLYLGREHFRIEFARRRFAAQLQDAVRHLGDAGFVRPIDEAVGREFDALAASLAEQHDALVALHRLHRRIYFAVEAVFAAYPGPCLFVSADGRVDRINAAVTQTFSITPEEAVGRPFLHVIRSHTIDQALRTGLESGKSLSLDVDIRIAQPPLQFEVRIEPIPATDGSATQGAVVLLHDVTRLRHLERVRKEFVANVSHELRTPITSIKGFIEILLEQEVSPQDRTRFLTILKQEVDRLNALVNDLLDLAYLEANPGAPAREPVDLEKIAREIFSLLEPQAREKEVHTEFVRIGEVPKVPAHRAMLEQALVDLVDNAIKYSPQGSTVRIEARRIAGEYVEIAVCDNGPGIPSEHLPRLFERFYRVDKARSKLLGGTGLGLAIVRHIVQRHNGSIRVESRLGKGSRFIITLPLRDEEGPTRDWDD